MAARRLSQKQPRSFSFSSESEKKIKFWLKKYPKGRQASAVIPLLWIAQEQEGWVSQKAIEDIAQRLEMPVMRVLEVATFYTMFHLEPVGKFHIQLCGTTPCALRGANDLKEVCERKIGSKKVVTKSGKFSWEEVECLGACVNAPMIQIGSDYYEDLDPQKLEILLDQLSKDGDVKAGPQSDRVSSEPAHEITSLREKKLYDGSAAKALKTIPNAP